MIVGLVGCPTWYYRLLFKSLIIFPLEGHCGYGSWNIENSYNHYIHHAKFNWNYGSSPYFDILFNTNYKKEIKIDSNDIRYQTALKQAEQSGFNSNVIN